MNRNVGDSGDDGNNSESLEKLKQKLKDLPKRILKDTSQLIRFLVACDGNVNDADKMFRDSLTWRENFKPDKIKKADIPNEIRTGKMFLHGRDKLGRPCLVIFPGKHDPNSRDLDETFKMVVFWIEKAIKKMKPGVEQFVVIYDVKASTHYNQSDWALLKEVIKLQEYYPERLGAVYVLRANWLFQLLLSMISTILDQSTINKIVILEENFKEHLRKHFTEDNLLQEHGGSLSSKDLKTSVTPLESHDSFQEHEKIKFIADAEKDVEKQKKITEEIKMGLENNLVISDVHKDLFKGALAQVSSETLNKERVILISSNVDTPAIHIKAASVLRDKAEKIQLDIANLAIRKQQLEWIIREAEQAKKEIPEIEQQLGQKRKDLYDTLKFMKNAEEVESKLSIVQNISKRQALIDKVPKLGIHKLDETEIVTISGPEKESTSQSYMDFVCAKSVSLYPLRKDTGREGDPIADRFNVCIFENTTIFALADGCGWGTPARDAATKATNIFVEYMKNFKSEITSTTQCVRFMLRAFNAAHSAILDSSDEENTAGTTTMLGGMVFELETGHSDLVSSSSKSSSSKWGIIFVSLGDCKAYKWTSSTGKVVDITEGNRVDVTDVRDPGGRLGGEGEPDLRNLEVYFTTAESNDIIMLVSDGVHDNLDPMFCGRSPKELNIPTEDNSWNSVKNDPLVAKVKSDWSLRLLSRLISERKTVLNIHGKPHKTTTAQITEQLIAYVLSLTKSSRSFMETNPNKKLPEDKAEYPGKMDHATSVSFLIGKK